MLLFCVVDWKSKREGGGREGVMVGSVERLVRVLLILRARERLVIERGEQGREVLSEFWENSVWRQVLGKVW